MSVGYRPSSTGRSRCQLTPYRQPILASEFVRYVGEPVALVVATDAYLAEDAANLVSWISRTCRRFSTRGSQQSPARPPLPRRDVEQGIRRSGCGLRLGRCRRRTRGCGGAAHRGPTGNPWGRGLARQRHGSAPCVGERPRCPTTTETPSPKCWDSRPPRCIYTRDTSAEDSVFEVSSIPRMCSLLCAPSVWSAPSAG